MGRGADNLPSQAGRWLIERGFIMNLGEFKQILDKIDDSKEVIFYNLLNNELQGKKLETVLDVDGRCEITVEDFDE